MSSQHSRTGTQSSPGQHGLPALIEMISSMSAKDIDNSLAKRNDSSQTAGRSDADLAYSLFAEEAEGLLNVAKDNLAHDVVNQDSFLEKLLEIEETARYDHLMAIALSEGRDPPPRPQRPRRNIALPELQPCRARVSSADHRSTAPELETDISRGLSLQRAGPPSSSLSPLSSPGNSLCSRAPSSDGSSLEYLSDSDLSEPEPEPDTIPSCVVCRDEIDGPPIAAPCGHHIDVVCLRQMFENAARDESLFPPQCCQEPIEFEDVIEHLSPALRELYARKSREFATEDRVYCHLPGCSTFLGGASKGRPTSLACTSPSCSARTCGSCKYAAHGGKACADYLDDIVLELGEEQGWRRCPSCRHLIERTNGCRHMTCRCGGEFCYGCARPWTGGCSNTCNLL